MATIFHLCLITALCLPSVLGSMMTGGWHNHDPNDPKIQKLAILGLATHNRQSNSVYEYKLVRVISAKTQVVAGTKYNVTVEIGETDCRKNYSESNGNGQFCDSQESNVIEASGVKVDSGVTLVFQQMKLKKGGKKVICFGFSKDEKYIVVQEDKEILTNDCENFFQKLKALFPPNKCCYALLDINYITTDANKQELVFVMWSPDSATCKDKLLHASSKPYLKQTFSGVNKQWEIHSPEDLTVDHLAQKLDSAATSVEGHPV